jgi:hypothetical protein
MVYPFVFQDCASYLEREKVSLWSYFMARLNGAMREYWMVLVLLCQILLNARIKSGNGFSWLMIYFLMLCYLGDNIQILIVPSSVWSFLFVLKEGNFWRYVRNLVDCVNLSETQVWEQFGHDPGPGPRSK